MSNQKIKHKNNNGITLIALIVTIVVLLILAVVAIGAVQNDGIINHAKNAKEEYGKAGVNENATLGNYLAKLDENVPRNDESEEDDVEKEVITNYTAEEIEASEYLYAIGKTVSTYVVAEFNEDYTEVTITKNGEESDGAIMIFPPWNASPMTKNSSTLKTVIIKNGITDFEGSSAGTGPFSKCTQLANVTIPNSVTRIDVYAFKGCTGLTNIKIPNSVTSIRSEAFSGCTGLTNVKIPNSVISIGSISFCDCSNLSEVLLPSSVTIVESGAFKNIKTDSTIYCETQAVADLLIADTNYTAANTTVVVDASKFE